MPEMDLNFVQMETLVKAQFITALAQGMTIEAVQSNAEMIVIAANKLYAEFRRQQRFLDQDPSGD